MVLVGKALLREVPGHVVDAKARAFQRIVGVFIHLDDLQAAANDAVFKAHNVLAGLQGHGLHRLDGDIAAGNLLRNPVGFANLDARNRNLTLFIPALTVTSCGLSVVQV